MLLQQCNVWLTKIIMVIYVQYMSLFLALSIHGFAVFSFYSSLFYQSPSSTSQYSKMDLICFASIRYIVDLLPHDYQCHIILDILRSFIHSIWPYHLRALFSRFLVTDEVIFTSHNVSLPTQFSVSTSSQGSSVSIVTDYGLDSCSLIPGRGEIFLFSTVSRLALDNFTQRHLLK
jgi:hypothetical protein